MKPGSKDFRIEGGITRGKRIEIFVNGDPVAAYAGETIGAALSASGIRALRRAEQLRDPRGLYCCMGTCHGCLVTVDGMPNIRGCVKPVQNAHRSGLQ